MVVIIAFVEGPDWCVRGGEEGGGVVVEEREGREEEWQGGDKCKEHSSVYAPRCHLVCVVYKFPRTT